MVGEFYATAGGAPHLRFPVRIIGAVALLNHLVAEDHKDRDGAMTRLET